jgi:type IV pilus assembly protein PilN
MPRINLLPWRAQQRKERQKNFAIAVLLAVVSAG